MGWTQLKCISYCWCTKSCTSWYGKDPIIYRVLLIPGGCLGFQPSTVCLKAGIIKDADGSSRSKQRVPSVAGIQLLLEIFSSWWFQTLSIFTFIWGNDPFWLIFFKGVETTNQYFPSNKNAAISLSWWNMTIHDDLCWMIPDKNFVGKMYLRQAHG